VEFIENDFLIDYQHVDLTEHPIYTGNSRPLQLFVCICVSRRIEWVGIDRAVPFATQPFGRTAD